jgi:hypothetical protein
MFSKVLIPWQSFDSDVVARGASHATFASTVVTSETSNISAVAVSADKQDDAFSYSPLAGDTDNKQTLQASPGS